MKKSLLAGIILIVLMILIVYVGRIVEFSWGGEMPGTRPSQLWERHVSEDLKVVERVGKVTIKEVLEDSTSIKGIDYNGRDVWEETWEGHQEILFDEHCWGHIDLSEGIISVFDYSGKLVRRAKSPAEYKHFWLGSQGEILFSRSDSSGQDRLEGLYGEKGVLFNARGEQVLDESFAGMGILEMKLLPGAKTLLISLVEIYPYLSTKVVFTTMEGHRIVEARGEQLFFSPVILEESHALALASGSNLYGYSFDGVPLFKKEWEESIKDVFAGPEESLLLVISPEQTLKEKTSLICLDQEGSLLWEKELPGGYQQGKSRIDGGMVIETDLFLYLLQSDGNIQGYYSPQEGQKIYLLSNDTFLARDRGMLTAYRWPLK